MSSSNGDSFDNEMEAQVHLHSVLQPAYTSIVEPEEFTPSQSYDQYISNDCNSSYIHNGTLDDKRRFALNCTSYWLLQIVLQLIISLIYLFGVTFLGIRTNETIQNQVNIFICTSVMVIGLLLFTNINMRSRNSPNCLLLYITLTIGYAVIQAEYYILAIYYIQNNSGWLPVLIFYMGAAMGALTISGLFVFISVITYLINETQEVSVKSSLSFVITFPILVGLLVALIFNSIEFTICCIIFMVVGPLYGIYYIYIITKLINRGKYCLKYDQYISAVSILFKGMIMPCTI